MVDTAGQDEYSIFPTQYAVDIHGYVLVYSINSLRSFQMIKILYDKIVDMVGNPKVPVVLVGNKKDLEVEVYSFEILEIQIKTLRVTERSAERTGRSWQGR